MHSRGFVKTEDSMRAIAAAIGEYTCALEKTAPIKHEDVLELRHLVFSAVTGIVEVCDNYANGHMIRTQLYLKALLDGLIQSTKCPNKYTEELSRWHMGFFLQSSLLHDIGKITISRHILNKPARFTENEFEIMKTHVAAGVDAITKILGNEAGHAFTEHALLVIGTHHERWDGSGYPAGLSGDSIPLEGRLMAIADVYDALISKRPYKQALSHQEACRIIETSSGTHFDPILVDTFCNVEAIFSRINIMM